MHVTAAEPSPSREVTVIGVRELTGDEARELEPALGSAVKKAVYFPQAGHCTDPFRLVQALAKHFLRTGGRLVRDTVKGFEFGGEGPRRLVTERGRMSVDTPVLAAGAWSGPLIRQLGSPIPLESE